MGFGAPGDIDPHHRVPTPPTPVFQIKFHSSPGLLPSSLSMTPTDSHSFPEEPSHSEGQVSLPHEGSQSKCHKLCDDSKRVSRNVGYTAANWYEHMASQGDHLDGPLHLWVCKISL